MKKQKDTKKVKTVDIYKIYEEEMENEYQFHQIPHLTRRNIYSINWYPSFVGEGKDRHVEYFLTVYGGGKQLYGSFEQWKRGKGLI